jgi:hypothetical protein
MNIFELEPYETQRDKLRDLIDLHGFEFVLARELLRRASDETCNELLTALKNDEL